jgi:hypothetical protein
MRWQPQRGFSAARQTINCCTCSLLVERRTPASTIRIGPCAGDQAAVPAQQGVRLDDEARPTGPWQRAADGGKQCAVGGLQPWPWNLAAQDGQLVAQDQDLQVLGGIAAGEQDQQLDGAGQREVGEFG